MGGLMPRTYYIFPYIRGFFGWIFKFDIIYILVRRSTMAEKKEQRREVILCMHCGNKTEMTEVAQYVKEYPDYEEDAWGKQMEIAMYRKTWRIFMCPVCEEVTIIFHEYSDCGYEPYIKDTQLFPQANFEFEGVPKNILNSYEAALKCRHLDGALCAIGLRKTLEIICKEFGETGYGIEKKLRSLSEKGILPPYLSKVAYILKDVGNEAAHGDDTDLPKEIINSLIEFTQTIINYLYVLPHNLMCIEKQMERRKRIAAIISEE